MIANELKRILAGAGEDGPFVMVGHAFGGAYARIFAGHDYQWVKDTVHDTLEGYKILTDSRNVFWIFKK